MRFFSRSGVVHKTPLFFQMEGVECGAASLGMILGYFGAHHTLRELRDVCYVSRDGVKASTILKAAESFGLVGDAHKVDSLEVFFGEDRFPCIIFWKFFHFLVVEGFKNNYVYVNDPAIGRYRMTREEFDLGFTGIVLTFRPSAQFKRQSQATSFVTRIRFWFQGCSSALWYLVFIGVGMIIPALLIPALLELFVDRYLIDGQVAWRFGLILAFGVTLFGQAVLLVLMRYFSLRLERGMAVRFSRKLVRALLRLPMRFFSQRFPGDLAFRVLLPERISGALGIIVVGFLVQILCAVFYLVLMGAYDIKLMLVTLVLAALSMVALWQSIRLGGAILHHVGKETSRLNELNLTALSSIHTLKATGREMEFFQQWSGQQARVLSYSQTLSLTNERLDILPMVTQGIVQLAIFGFGGYLAMHGEISLGRLVAFQSLALAFFKPITDLLFSIHQFQQLGIDLARSEDVLHQPESEFVDIAYPVVHESDFTGELIVKGLTFGYQRREAPLISQFDLTVPSGSRVAIVGASGSGKSTVAKLIAGLYSPWEGQILVDGVDLFTLDPAFRSQLIGVVDQDMVFFDGSIRDNMTLWDHSIMDEAVILAAKDAQLHHEILRREGGYDAMLIGGAKSLSGGQRQRLEIARVLARAPKILIMDEATSALDPLVEFEVDQAIRRRRCTVIIIAHRLSTIRDADHIVVLDKGVVVASGTHESLMAHPYYATLVRSE